MSNIKMEYEPTYFTTVEFDNLLQWLHKQGTSDITIQSGENVIADIKGILYRVTRRKLTYQEVSDLINNIYGANGTAQVQSGTDLDTSYQLNIDGEMFRYRINITACLVNGYNGLQVTLRTIASQPPHIDTMGVDKYLQAHLLKAKGVTVISGATGSGKSTLLSSVIANIVANPESNLKVLTYESPIEYVYDHVIKPSSIVSQTEIPKHLPTFSAGIRNALRRKPGLILVGEARDRITVESVIEASLTGHPVYTTLHSNGVVDTFRRMINLFPAEERQSRLHDLIETVRILVWQTLAPTTDGNRTPLREYLVITDAVKDEFYASNGENVTNIFKNALITHGRPLIDDINEKLAANIISERTARTYKSEI